MADMSRIEDMANIEDILYDVELTDAELVSNRNRPNQEIASSDWLFICIGRLLVSNDHAELGGADAVIERLHLVLTQNF